MDTNSNKRRLQGCVPSQTSFCYQGIVALLVLCSMSNFASPVIACEKVLCAGFAVSGFINKAMFGETEKVAASAGAGMEVSVMDSSAMLELLSGVNVGEALIALVAVICGMLFFCMLAGLCGATASKLEEMAESIKLYTMLLIVGFLLSFAVVMMMVSGAGNPTFTNICCLVPISSPFLLPACLLLGKVPLGISIIGLVILVVFVWALFTKENRSAVIFLLDWL